MIDSPRRNLVHPGIEIGDADAPLVPGLANDHAVDTDALQNVKIVDASDAPRGDEFDRWEAVSDSIIELDVGSVQHPIVVDIGAEK